MRDFSAPRFADTIKLLRIPFSLLLMPVFLLAVSQSAQLNLTATIVSFVIIHLLVYPASNGYNSYIDKDTDSIGGLEKPPLPTKALFYLTMCMDVLAIAISLFAIGATFAASILCYILASRAYSSRLIRLKKYPFTGLLIVVVFQGGFTYYMCSIGISGAPFPLSVPNMLIMSACSLQIAGAYPLTQIYQHKQDLDDDVKTISYTLGYKGTFIFTSVMFILCNIAYYLYFRSTHHEAQFYYLQLFFSPVIIYFLWWFLQVVKDTANANFKNTMRMNMIAAVCMNVFFTFLIFANHRN